ncbi:MAG: hypothetical protein JRI42_08950 [Deltaproteobacteria bacterium]|nr:hypothetical protein [Deltaproteobacteria bacterium]
MKKDFLALDNHTTLKENPVYNQTKSDGFIIRNGYESKIVNLMRLGK